MVCVHGVCMNTVCFADYPKHMLACRSKVLPVKMLRETKMVQGTVI